MVWKIKFYFGLIILIHFSSCGIYSITGANISPDIKTISIGTFYNNAALGPTTMSVTFTEKIKDYFQQNTSLNLIDENGDLQIEGYISDYTLTPVAPSANTTGGTFSPDLASQTRITIIVTCTYYNTKDETFNFERKNFSFFKDFNQDEEELSSIEEEYVGEIFDQIIIDIFNGTVANW